MKKKPFPTIGDQAPDFILKDQHNEEFRLSSLKGKKVVLSFHPLAWTSVCAKQMKSLSENQHVLEKLNTVPVGISVDSVPCKRAWAKELRIESMRLLSDFWPHGGVAALFGILRDKDGFSERANIVVGEDGIIIFFKRYDIPELPDVSEIIGFLKK